jgi:hypothetical protein
MQSNSAQDMFARATRSVCQLVLVGSAWRDVRFAERQRRQIEILYPVGALIRRAIWSPFPPDQYFPDRLVRRHHKAYNYLATQPNQPRLRRAAWLWRGRAASAGCHECCATPDMTGGTDCNHCRRRRFGCAAGPSENHVAIQNHVGIGLAFHRQMAIDHLVAKDAADVAFHHPTKAVVTGADGNTDIVDFIFE